MKIYKHENINGKNLYCLMHWDYDMRSFQIEETMVLLIQHYESEHWINPGWKELIKGFEIQFLVFLRDESYSWDVQSVEDIIPYIEKKMNNGEIRLIESDY